MYEYSSVGVGKTGEWFNNVPFSLWKEYAVRQNDPFPS